MEVYLIKEKLRGDKSRITTEVDICVSKCFTCTRDSV